MNRQNILNFYGSKLDLKLDSSELYDYELGKVDLDYNSEVLDLDNEITYNTIKINNSLSNMDCVKTTITLQEFDNTVNDEDYIFSGLTFTLSYSDFISYFNVPYEHTILNDDVFVLTGLTNETHYFTIYQYNRTDLPLIGVYGFITDNNGDTLLTSNGDSLIYTDPTSFNSFYSLFDVSDDSFIVTTNNEELLVFDEVTTPLDVMNLFDKKIISCVEKLEDIDNCCSQSPKLNAKPWAYKFDTGSGLNNCDPIIKRRTEKGWSLDFIFNRNSNPWSLGSVFYYLGVRGENDPYEYADNNLSFQFTSDRRIKWVSHHYSGICGTDGFEESFYIASGQTPQLCVTDPTKDFNITIVFDRYKRYRECNLENDGGWNDLIPEFITSDYVNTGVTAVTSTQLSVANNIELLNKKWSDEKQRRLGILKIYLNGRPIYKLEDWEEIIPSERGVQPYIQSWGGGTGLMNGIHNGVSCFDIKSIKYYEEPLGYVHVRHNFLTRLNNYDFEICGLKCVDDVFGMIPTALPTNTPTPTPTSTPLPTSNQTPTPTVTPSGTPLPTSTQTPTPTVTLSPTVTPSGTPLPTSTQTPTVTPNPTPTINYNYYSSTLSQCSDCNAPTGMNVTVKVANGTLNIGSWYRPSDNSNSALYITGTSSPNYMALEVNNTEYLNCYDACNTIIPTSTPLPTSTETPTPTPTPTEEPINFNLEIEISSGSIILDFNVTSSRTINRDVTIPVISYLNLLTSEILTIEADITIFSGELTGSTRVELIDRLFSELDLSGDIAVGQISIDGYEYEVSAQLFFNSPTPTPTETNEPTPTPTFTLYVPENDFTYVIIPGNDLVYNIIPNNDLTYSLIPSNDLTSTLLPNNDLEYLILPLNDVNYTLIPNNDSTYTLIPNNDIRYTILRPTPNPTSTPNPTPTPTPTSTETPIPTETNTPIPTETNTPIPTETGTPTPTSTETGTPTPTLTSTPTETPTPEGAVLVIEVSDGTPFIIFDGEMYTSTVSAGIFKNQQYTINADVSGGGFLYWEGTNVNLPSATSSFTVVTVTGNTATLRAVFSVPTPTSTPIPTSTLEPLNFTISSVCTNNGTIVVNNFVGVSSGQYAYSVGTYTTENSALNASTWQFVSSGSNGIVIIGSNGTYWVAVRDFNNPTYVIAKSVTISC